MLQPAEEGFQGMAEKVAGVADSYGPHQCPQDVERSKIMPGTPEIPREKGVTVRKP